MSYYIIPARLTSEITIDDYVSATEYEFLARKYNDLVKKYDPPESYTYVYTTIQSRNI